MNLLAIITIVAFCTLVTVLNYRRQTAAFRQPDIHEGEEWAIFSEWVRDTSRRDAWTGEQVSYMAFQRFCKEVEFQLVVMGQEVEK